MYSVSIALTKTSTVSLVKTTSPALPFLNLTALITGSFVISPVLDDSNTLINVGDNADSATPDSFVYSTVSTLPDLVLTDAVYVFNKFKANSCGVKLP